MGQRDKIKKETAMGVAEAKEMIEAVCMKDEKKIKEKSLIAKREEEILEFWKQKKIFEKMEKKKKGQKEFIFYDGPPFATGLPHYGNILPGTIKDVIPRYQTMLGKFVVRKWGWDCHGLPIENLIEKELNLKTKKDIEKLGIDIFNEAARKSVLHYTGDWKKIVSRLGRWVDMENSYKTMDANYTETVWWVFKTLYDKGLIYKGFKSMHLCPRCETTLSNFEVSQGYKDITDISVYIKFKLSFEKDTFVLAWTTTPWTLPGNVALAVNSKTKYVKVKIEKKVAEADIEANEKVEVGIETKFKIQEKKVETKVETEYLILAKNKLADVLKDIKYEIFDEFEGEKLVGKSYEPIFDYYKNTNIKNKENAWKIYGGDFVTTEDGTGIVHIAPAFGVDDLVLAQKNKLPIIYHVGTDGKFKQEVVDFAGKNVKPKENPQEADIEVLKNLSKRSFLFAKKKIIHSYPHCWRCETPLLNYASSSWFVNVPAIKEKMIFENKKVNWIPKDLRDGRFGKWLENARDWAISRFRYWGAPIPVWECKKCRKSQIFGSIDDIRKKLKTRNNYFVIRHGEAESNIKKILNSDQSKPAHLTKKGEKQAIKNAEKLSLNKEKIDFIFTSPFPRAKETALIFARILGIPTTHIYEDNRICEINTGFFDGKKVSEYYKYFSSVEERFVKTPFGGENYMNVKKRMGEFLRDIDNRFEGKNIIIVTHDAPAWLLFSSALYLNTKESISFRGKREFFLENAIVRKMEFLQMPHNNDFEIDLHRPYIDKISFNCVCGEKMERVPEVFDCWFESGAMPYGQNHYPFENIKNFNPKKLKRYPANFIAEGLDQTRGWFYSLLVLGVALFGKSPYKNVVVNGLILAEDGRKMSKHLKNYPDMMETVDKYGADALRYYLLSSLATHAEELRFSERGIDEVVKKIILKLQNIYSFYELYKEKGKIKESEPKSKNILDKWILTRFNELALAVGNALNSYELDRASRYFLDFIDDFSVWYLRRSRERFKEHGSQKKDALATTYFLLLQTSKLIAPFMPFLAEDLYQKMGGKKDSVHLELWPKIQNKKDGKKIIQEMKEARKIVSLSLEARSVAGIKVRQPLQNVKVKSLKLKKSVEIQKIICDEINVKEIIFDSGIKEEAVLDIVITKELKEEGQIRELIRNIQDLRKGRKLKPLDLITLVIETDRLGEELVKRFEKKINKISCLKKIVFTANQGKIVELDDKVFRINIL